MVLMCSAMRSADEVPVNGMSLCKCEASSSDELDISKLGTRLAGLRNKTYVCCVKHIVDKSCTIA